MGRMHSKGKGMSGSALPYKRTPPSWLKITGREVCSCSPPQHQLLSEPLRPEQHACGDSFTWCRQGPLRIVYCVFIMSTRS